VNIQPALVLQRAAVPLPRTALWLFCASWVLPGVLGRDPWRNADVQAYGIMAAMAEGRTSWWSPSLGGVPVDVALLPHWLGALTILAGEGWLDPMLAARMPFALLLAATLACVWWSTFLLAQTGAARPLPLAFGGEAQPLDYARALADGAVLALIATLGLLQLGHETTPELAQLAATGLFLTAMAGSANAPRLVWPKAAAITALPLLAASGAPSIALAFSATASLACVASRQPRWRRFVPWLLLAGAAAAALSAGMELWRWRLTPDLAFEEAGLIARQWLWFMWPAWLLVLWTLWVWRKHLWAPHVAAPLALTATAVAASVLMGGSDRALMLALPGLAVLAAFALPTLARSAAAAIDWFSICFFTAAALFIWFMYIAMQTGIPAKPAANVAKLALDFVPSFQWSALVPALAATLAWLALVRWRTGRHPHALWKSMVLPAGGVALCWILLMTLWLPLLDYARSARPLVQRVTALVGDSPCIAGVNFSTALSASFEIFWGHPVDARPSAAETTTCPVLVRITRGPAMDTPHGWVFQGATRRPTERNEIASVYRRAAPGTSAPANASPTENREPSNAHEADAASTKR
jgi:hypothetical protein